MRLLHFWCVVCLGVRPRSLRLRGTSLNREGIDLQGLGISVIANTLRSDCVNNELLMLELNRAMVSLRGMVKLSQTTIMNACRQSKQLNSKEYVT
ncbi:hypothetical protein BJX70DRAFT_87768 [Aspergillus crustosus]